MNLGLLTCFIVKLVSWHWVVMKLYTAFICKALSKENGQFMLKRPEHPIVVFRGGFSKAV